LGAHPPAFRKQFATEMLWIFDESTAGGARRTILFDGFVSLLRQWLLRSGAWKLLAAAILGLAQITVGGFGWVLIGYLHGTSHRPDPPFDSNDLARLMYLVVWTAGGVIVIALALWVKKFTARRIHRDA
jgi:hypothetical protein